MIFVIDLINIINNTLAVKPESSTSLGPAPHKNREDPQSVTVPHSPVACSCNAQVKTSLLKLVQNR